MSKRSSWPSEKVLSIVLPPLFVVASRRREQFCPVASPWIVTVVAPVAVRTPATKCSDSGWQGKDAVVLASSSNALILISVSLPSAARSASVNSFCCTAPFVCTASSAFSGGEQGFVEAEVD